MDICCIPCMCSDVFFALFCIVLLFVPLLHYVFSVLSCVVSSCCFSLYSATNALTMSNHFSCLNTSSHWYHHGPSLEPVAPGIKECCIPSVIAHQRQVSGSDVAILESLSQSEPMYLNVAIKRPASSEEGASVRATGGEGRRLIE